MVVMFNLSIQSGPSNIIVYYRILINSGLRIINWLLMISTMEQAFLDPFFTEKIIAYLNVRENIFELLFDMFK